MVSGSPEYSAVASPVAEAAASEPDAVEYPALGCTERLARGRCQAGHGRLGPPFPGPRRGASCHGASGVLGAGRQPIPAAAGIAGHVRRWARGEPPQVQRLEGRQGAGLCPRGGVAVYSGERRAPQGERVRPDREINPKLMRISRRVCAALHAPDSIWDRFGSLSRINLRP